MEGSEDGMLLSDGDSDFTSLGKCEGNVEGVNEGDTLGKLDGIELG